MQRLILFWVMLLPFVCTAATDTGTEADHQQLRELLKIARQAVNNDQPALLEEHLHPDYVITVMNQQVVTKDMTLEQLFHDWFKKPDAILKGLQIQPEATIKTNIYGDSFGVCYGTSADTYELSDGRKFTFDSKWTATLIKDDGQWKLLALHVGVDPISNPLIDGYRKGLGFGGVFIEFNRRLFH